MTEGAPLLELRGVSKVFGAVRALDEVNFTVPAGKVTALAGDNGAGKSVTIKTISGLWEPTEGEILWEGKPVHFHSPNDAEALGITTIYQDLALCDNLDIVQNMFLGHERLRHGLLDESSMEMTARKTLADLHVTTVRSIRQPVPVALGRPAPVGRRGEGGDAVGQARDHGRAHRRPRRGADRPGARADQAAVEPGHGGASSSRTTSTTSSRWPTRSPSSTSAAWWPRARPTEFDRQVVVDYMTTGESSRTAAG